MSRVYKFRAWDLHQKKMYELGSLKLPIPETSIVMQYTGLKDKNGREIYEGDLLSGPNINDGDPAVVKWSDNWTDPDSTITYATWFLEGRAGLSSLADELDVNGGLEVIGNIYENPELLEQGA